MSKTLKLVGTYFLAIILLQTVSAATPVRKCSNNHPLPLLVQMDSCQQMPCDVYRGFTSNMAIQFVSPKNNLSGIKADARLTTLGIGMPFQLDAERSDVCKNLLFDAYCPMDQNEDATYHLFFDIGEYQPEVPANIQVSLKDSKNNEEFACFIVDIRIRKYF